VHHKRLTIDGITFVSARRPIRLHSGQAHQVGAVTAPRLGDATPIASRPHCKHLPRMIPGFGAGLVIETRSLPNLLVATLATLPSMSLIPSAPFPICGNRRQCARCNRKRRRGAGADRIGQDLHLRAALSEPENSGGVHRPDPRVRKYRSIAPSTD
jgi:hypothetical protein